MSAVRRPPLAQAVWSLSLCPAAGEGGGSFQPTYRPPRTVVAGAPAKDPQRAQAEAARRARRNLRRYCAANGLNRLGTLTYRGSGCRDPRQARADVAAFFIGLRDLLGRRALPYVWVPEWHKNHGLHLHFAVGRYVKRSLIEDAWGRGFVHIKLLGDLPVGSGRWAEARRAAGYLSKYVAKTFDDAGSVKGLHRYEVAQGFQPALERLTGSSRAAVLAAANERMGGFPRLTWFSEQTEDWQGPPAYWAAW